MLKRIEGVLAMMPDENLYTTLKKPGRLYLGRACFPRQ